MASKQDNSRQKIISISIGVGVAIALFAGYYMLSHTPTEKKIENIRREIKAKDKKLKTARAQAPLLKPLKEKVEWLESQLEVLRAKVATKGEVISLIRTIEEEAIRQEIKVIDVSTTTKEPSPPSQTNGKDSKSKNKKRKKKPQASKPAYSKLVLDANMQGDYYKLERFLKTLQNMESLVIIEEIGINKSKKIDPLLALNLKMSLYSKK